MSKLYVVSVESDVYGCGNLFLDEDHKILGFVADNDGNWRHEYFNGIFRNYGLFIECKQVSDFGEDVILNKLKDYFGF